MDRKMNCLFLLIVLCCIPGIAQQGTEIYLADLVSINDTLEIGSAINISNNEGYDNQPSFYDDDHILFSSTRNGQTDIALYSISDKTTRWISDTANGSEYSPLKMPGKESVSAIRLDDDGLQRLYAYDLKTGVSKELLPNLKVGYHVWYTPHILICTVLVEDRMDLVVSDMKNGTNQTVQKNVGRSIHVIPDSDLISFVSKENRPYTVKSLHPGTGEIKILTTLLDTSEDIAWSSNGTLLTADDKKIVRMDPTTVNNWQSIKTFQEHQIQGISRLAMSMNGKHMAFVSLDTLEGIVQKQVDTFNARDLDAFAACFTEDVVVSNFPADTMNIGRSNLKDTYRKFYERTPSVEVKVASRIRLGSTVIDQEVVTIGDEQNLQVAIYETDGLIKTMTFIRDQKTDSDPERIVQTQLDAYNNRDIDAFLATYAEGIQLYNFPETIRNNGLDTMRKGYTNLFENTPDLHCEIKNRMVIGNKVIDEEFVTANGTTFSAIAIYEVDNGKITRVTFIR
ncbi:MAG: nuclear transport factor 2 family protein [Maribacter sp.]